MLFYEEEEGDIVLWRRSKRVIWYSKCISVDNGDTLPLLVLIVVVVAVILLPQ